jgi:hypothetical protein
VAVAARVLLLHGVAAVWVLLLHDVAARVAPPPPRRGGGVGPLPWCSTSMAVGSGLDLAGLDPVSSIFLLLKINFWCRLT